MNAERLRMLLTEVRDGTRSLDDALTALKAWPYEDIGYARLDHHRSLRKGFPEVVFCEGKTPDQAAEIIMRLAAANESVMATRASAAIYNAVQSRAPEARYYEQARIILVERKAKPSFANASEVANYVVVATGGTADMPVAEEASVTAEVLGLSVRREYDVGVAGVHRLLDRLQTLQEARVIIAVAGMDGILPTIISGLVGCPVIAVPTSVGYGTGVGGVAALLTMLNTCAPGLACVNIDNGFGAGVMAYLILRSGEC
jgi:NCAIR mutase (PurE)-related protein